MEASMILSIGEILADMIGEKENGNTVYRMFCGGAPFNVAFNAAKSGAKTAFIGNVGDDVIGRELKSIAQSTLIGDVRIGLDRERNTTLAFVSVSEKGERDFTFFRKGTADYNLDADAIDLSKYEGLGIVHLGSLMFSEKEGRRFASKIIKKVKDGKYLLSIDANFRMDLYDSVEEAVEAYKPFIEKADILKFSDDEILDYTGAESIEKGAESLVKPGRLLAVTMGNKGSMLWFDGKKYIVPPSEAVEPVDTTGAGDAFYGALLARIDEKGYRNLTIGDVIKAFEYANKKGGEATLHKGAIQL